MTSYEVIEPRSGDTIAGPFSTWTAAELYRIELEALAGDCGLQVRCVTREEHYSVRADVLAERSAGESPTL